MKRFLLYATIGWLASSLSDRYLRKCATRRQKSPASPEHIQTWEGEGGGVPVGEARTAAQVRPATGLTVGQGTDVAPDNDSDLAYSPSISRAPE